MGHQQEKAAATWAHLKEAKKELKEAKSCMVEFERAMAKKESNLKQKDTELKKKDHFKASTTTSSKRVDGKLRS